MLNKWVKRAGLIVIVLAIIGAFFYATRERPTLVDVATVARGPMDVTVREEGTTEVRDVYTVSAPTAGELLRTELEEGDPVVAGKTVVATLQPPSPPLIDSRTQAELSAAADAAQKAVAVAEIDLARAKTALAHSDDQLERLAQLNSKGVVSDNDFKEANNEVAMQRAALLAAEATLEMQQAQLASAQARLASNGTPAGGTPCCVSLKAPVDGVVLSVYARSAQPVAAGAKIADIGDPRDLQVSVDLLSSDAVRIGPGTLAAITDWGGDRALSAVVRRVEPAAFTKVSVLGVEEQRVHVVLDLDQTDPRLGDKFRVFAEMTVWTCPDCMVVPISALFRDGTNWNVFRIDGDRLAQVQVEIGHMNDTVAEVLKGLDAGQRVVVHPSDTLAAGKLVSMRETE